MGIKKGIVAGCVLWSQVAVGSPEVLEVPQIHYWIGGGAGALAWVLELLPEADRPGWRGPVLLDEEAQRVLKAETSGGRQAAASVSDVLLGGLILAPGAAYLSASWAAGDPVRFAPIWVSAESLMLAALASQSTKYLFRRERPDGSNFESFVSGHATMTFAGAGLVCSGRVWEDGRVWVPCATALALASATGALRVVADRHYLSDVLAGAAVGGFFGYFYPWLAYPDADDNDRRDQGSVTSVAPILRPDQVGLRVAFAL